MPAAADTTEEVPSASSYSDPIRRSPTAGEQTASMVSVPIPDWMRFSVTVGSRGLRIVRLPEAASGTGRRWGGGGGGGAAAGIGAVGGAGLDRSSDVAGAAVDGAAGTGGVDRS